MKKTRRIKKLRLGPAILLSWIAFLAVANYLSFWNQSRFAQLVSPGDPVYTVHPHLAGWPLSYGKQVYSRQTTTPSISFEPNLMRGIWNLLLCVSVLVSVHILFWHINCLSILHMLKVTAMVAILLALANMSASKFGWSFWHCFFIYAFISPFATIAAKVPYYIISKTLEFMRERKRPIAT